MATPGKIIEACVKDLLMERFGGLVVCSAKAFSGPRCFTSCRALP
jgi:hypothetical protein